MNEHSLDPSTLPKRTKKQIAYKLALYAVATLLTGGMALIAIAVVWYVGLAFEPGGSKLNQKLYAWTRVLSLMLCILPFSAQAQSWYSLENLRHDQNSMQIQMDRNAREQQEQLEAMNLEQQRSKMQLDFEQDRLKHDIERDNYSRHVDEMFASNVSNKALRPPAPKAQVTRKPMINSIDIEQSTPIDPARFPSNILTPQELQDLLVKSSATVVEMSANSKLTFPQYKFDQFVRKGLDHGLTIQDMLFLANVQKIKLYEHEILSRKDNANSQLVIGMYLLYGLLVEQDQKKGIDFLKLSAAKGQQLAKTILEKENIE
jgi:hypothetical protein